MRDLILGLTARLTGAVVLARVAESLCYRFRQAFLQFRGKPLLEVAPLLERKQQKPQAGVTAPVSPNRLAGGTKLVGPAGQAEFKLHPRAWREPGRSRHDLHTALANVHGKRVRTMH